MRQNYFTQNFFAQKFTWQKERITVYTTNRPGMHVHVYIYMHAAMHLGFRNPVMRKFLHSEYWTHSELFVALEIGRVVLSGNF